jgi:predicted transcriptional regulator
MNEIVKFLLENGEKTVPEMRFPHLTRPTLNGKLRNLFEKGAIDRRMVTTSRGDIWSYFAITGPNRVHQFKNEPDPVYFLRNLPKKNLLEYSITLLEESHG